MTVLTREKFRALTRSDYDGAPLQEAIDLAQGLLEDQLHRLFDEADVTDEKVIAYRHRSGFYTAYPKRLPVTAVASSGWEYTNTGILKSASSGFSIVYNIDYERQVGPDSYEVTVSYTGGFTTLTAPARLLLGIAKLAKQILDQNSGVVALPANVSSASVGGVSVSMRSDERSQDFISSEIWNIVKGFQRRQY